jgi:hypothetical protein
MTFRQNFTGFWNQWKHDVISRDCAFLDEIHPERIRSGEQWIRREEERARSAGAESVRKRVQPETLAVRTVLKLSGDHRRGVL